MTRPVPSDRGLASERTGLAWRRTILALLAGALLSLRLLPPLLGVWGLGAGILALAVTVSLWALSEQRFRRMRRVLVASGQLPDGRLALALALAVAGGGGLGLLYLLVARGLGWVAGLAEPR
jgi:uncharacterized membrane protein YidH (DUF202 family)